MSDKKKNVKRRNVKMSELDLPVLSKNIIKEMTRYRKMTKRLMMNDYFICLNPLQRRLARTKYFEEVLDNPDWTNWSNKPTAAIKKLNLRDLDFIHCLHAPKPVKRSSDRDRETDHFLTSSRAKDTSNISNGNGFSYSTSENGTNQVTNYNTTCTTANLAELFNTDNPFDIFSKFPQFNQDMTSQNNGKSYPSDNTSSVKNNTSKKDKKGNITTITNTTKTNNYSINLLPFVPIKLKTEPGEKSRFFVYTLVDEKPGQINIYYHYIRDYKFLICDKSKFLSPDMTQEEKESLYNTIIDSASLGIDQIINNDTYQYTEEDDKTLEELRNGELLQYPSRW